MKKLSSIFAATTFILSLFQSEFAKAQAPSIQWQKSYGSSKSDWAACVLKTTDGGYIFAGGSDSTDLSGSTDPKNDCWVVKINSTGALEWQKFYGGSANEVITDMKQTTDGGYVFVGWSSSNDGDVSGNHGSDDIWVVKLNSTGVIVWQKAFGSSNGEEAYSIIQTLDGGYIISGASSSFIDGDVTFNHGSYDAWIIKINSSGDIQWQKSYGGSLSEYATSIFQTSDGGYIFAGQSESNDGDVSGNHGGTDYWIVRISNGGNILWQKSLGGNSFDEPQSIIQTMDGGFLVVGTSNSSMDGDITCSNQGGVWAVKLNNNGIVDWQNCIEIGLVSNGILAETVGGEYLITGAVLANNGYADASLVKLNNNGGVVWQKNFGGTQDDITSSIQEIPNDGFIVAGFSKSNDGDVSGNHGNEDAWIVKLSNANGLEDFNEFSLIELFPNPTNDVFNLKSNQNQVGNTFEIFDNSGRVVLSGIINSDNMLIDASKLSNGVYGLAIQGDKSFVTKLIKN